MAMHRDYVAYYSSNCGTVELQEKIVKAYSPVDAHKKLEAFVEKAYPGKSFDCKIFGPPTLTKALKGEIKEDVWITPEDAAQHLLKLSDQVELVEERDGFLCALNSNNVVLRKIRIYNGTEHPKAQKDMCLEDTATRKMSVIA